MLDINLKYIKEKYSQLEEVFPKVTIDPNLKLFSARNGLPSLKYEKNNTSKLIHSKYDPMAEAVQFINSIDLKPKTIPVVIGFGLGYHIEALIKRYCEFEQIFIYEPRIDIIKLAAGNKDLSEILKQDNITIISSNSIQYITRHLAELLEHPQYHRRTRLIVHLPSLELYKSSHPELADLIQRMNVEPKMQKIMKENFQNNIGLTLRSPGIKTLFGKFSNKPILLISAGPSLADELDTIKSIQDNCIIISVTTCLRLLLDQNIRPDFITIGDPKQIMETHFDGIFDCNIPMIFLPTVSTWLLRKYTGPKIVALQNDYKLCDLIEQKKSKGRVDVGESVATMSLDLAIKFGGDPIIFVGQDLAFSDGHSHATGIKKRLHVRKNTKKTINVQGKEVATSMSLMWFKNWIERRIKQNPERTYINVSRTGARIKGTEELELNTVLKKFCSSKISK